jgi:hypothetical protein
MDVCKITVAVYITIIPTAPGNIIIRNEMDVLVRRVPTLFPALKKV